MKVKIVPTLLTQNFAEFKERLKRVEPFFNLVQIDCADGKFVKNKTFYEFEKVRKFLKFIKYNGSLELHLMVKDPLVEIKKWERFKKLQGVIFHYEAVRDDKKIVGIIEYLKQKGIKAGLAINPQTSVSKIIKYLPKLDLVLIMGVNPGWGGQVIKLKVVESKVNKVRKLYPKLNIGVDGGVNSKNIKQLIKAGANIIYMGTSLSQAETIKQIKNILK
jgi:ribulose-phosphate 3-epimerase